MSDTLDKYLEEKITTLEDGYKYFFPCAQSGGLSSYELRQIADRLDKLNADWDEQVQKEFYSD